MTPEEFFKRYTYDVDVDRIGGGGFGTVYKAYDNVLHHEVAIKVSELKKAPNGKTFSLRDEIEALSGLPEHPNIANYEKDRLFTFKTPQGNFDYAVMQYYPDGNLTQAIKQGLSDEQKDEIATQLLEGINFLHKHKVVHRDLKPGNILITRHGGHVIPLITDFGLSKAADTGDGSVFTNSFGGGTPRYSSPEQLKGEPLRFNTDLWSYGAIVYELFTGEQLFSPGSGASNSAQAELEVYNKIIHGNVDSLAKMPERWRKVAERCMVVDPEKRVKNAEELLFLLNGYTEATVAPGVVDTPTQPPIQSSSTIPITPITPKTLTNPTKPQPKPAEKKPSVPPKAETSSGGGKSRKGLWIGLAAVAVIALALVFLLKKPKEETPVPIDADTEAFMACQTVDDYRSYLREFGHRANHYDEAKHFVDSFVADSLAKAEELRAQQQAKEKADAETKAKADAEKREDEAYKKCVTIADCDSYLKTYPNGRYVTEVSTKRAELVQQQVIARAEADAKARLEAQKKEEAAFKGCTTIEACANYLKTYPNGRYVNQVKLKKVELEAKLAQQAQQVQQTANTSTNSNSNSSQTFTVKGVTFVMKRVEGGTFQMGATQEQGSDADSDESPVHSVTLSTYYIGETEVTQALWKAVMGTTVRQQRDKANPSWPMRGEGDNYPMYYVSWNECQEFVRELNRLTGENFRLPTEAEWEYAARGGKKSNGCKYSGSHSIDNVAWYDDNSGSKTHPVKGKNPNELGLYDMSGNVWEWCSDWKGSYGSGSQTNPTGPSSGSARVLRGGGWFDVARYCRVSIRDAYGPGGRYGNYGFRLALIQ